MTLSDCSFLQNLPLNYQLPFYSLLISIILPIHPHILVILNLNSLFLRQVCTLNLEKKKKKGAGYLRIEDASKDKCLSEVYHLDSHH